MLGVIPPHPHGETHPLEGCVIGPFQNAIVRNCTDDLIRHCFTGGKIIDCDLSAVYGYTEEKDFKLRGFSVLVYAAFLQIDVGECLQVDTESLYVHFITAFTDRRRDALHPAALDLLSRVLRWPQHTIGAARRGNAG